MNNWKFCQHLESRQAHLWDVSPSFCRQFVDAVFEDIRISCPSQRPKIWVYNRFIYLSLNDCERLNFDHSGRSKHTRTLLCDTRHKTHTTGIIQMLQIWLHLGH